MRSRNISPILLAFCLLLAPLCIAEAGEIPPQGSKSLSEILKSVEQQKLGGIAEAEFDDCLWEVKACDVGACQKLYIDPMSAEEKRRRKTDSDEMPPANAVPLSRIIQSVEARGLGILTEVEYDNALWELDLRKDGQKIKLTIDPRGGETRS